VQRGFHYRQHVLARGMVGGGRDQIRIHIEDGSVTLTGG
jgi:hypothetical protein